MAWIADVEYNQDYDGEEERAEAEAQTAAAILKEAGVEVDIDHVPRTPDAAGGYVWGERGFFRLYAPDEDIERGKKVLEAAGWNASAAIRRVQLGPTGSA